MKKTIKICFGIIFVILCCYLIVSTVSIYNFKIQARKQFWNQIDKNLTLINNEIDNVLTQNNEDTEQLFSLRTIALTCEDTGAIVDYNSKDLFDWYDGKSTWNIIASKIFDMATLNAKEKSFSQEEIEYLQNLQLANKKLLESLKNKASSLYSDKAYQTNLMEQYVSFFNNN